MSLTEIEAQIRALPKDQRLQFVSWFYEHENELVDATDDAEVSPEVMAELLRRRRELDTENVRTFSIEEAGIRVWGALDEVQCPLH